jgi:hypothetical protein
MQYEFKAGVNNYLKGSAIAIKSLTDVIDFLIKMKIRRCRILSKRL